MAKLSKEALNEGRRLLRSKDLEGFRSWHERHAPLRSYPEVERTLLVLFRHDQQERAVQIFDRAYMDYDPFLHRFGTPLRLAAVLAVALGVIGGIVYLIGRMF